MNDKVKLLMKLADRYSLASGLGDEAGEVKHRQALEAELTRLFTPLTEEQMRRIRKCNQGHDAYGRAIEAAHGITAEASPGKSAAYAAWSAENATAIASKVTEAACKAAHSITGGGHEPT